MINDYRNTSYCPALGDITKRKIKVEETIKKDHKRAKDMHNYLSPNDGAYKTTFIKAYNGKCSYCGVSNEIIPKELFEIDHFFCKSLKKFKTKAAAGKMDNLVLACHTCNRRKSNFRVTNAYASKLHPDKKGIVNQFYRDEKFNICLSGKADNFVKAFYEKLEFGDELRRLDFLLMSFYGLQNSLHSKSGMSDVYEKVGLAAELLRKKRNEL